MSLRVHATPEYFRVSKHGHEAWSSDPAHLVFSSTFYGQGGGLKGSKIVPASPKNDANQYVATWHAFALPAGTGVPIYFVWHDRTSTGAENEYPVYFSAFVAPDGSHIALRVKVAFDIAFHYFCYRRTGV
jgi:hypothetical protein